MCINGALCVLQRCFPFKAWTLFRVTTGDMHGEGRMEL